MLDLIRKKQKTVIIKVVFWAIIATFIGTIFLVWGKGSNRGGNDPTMAAVVNGTRIGYDDYQTAYSNLYRMYQNVYREKFTPALEKKLGLRQQALNALVEETLLVQEARRQGLDVSRKELVQAIAEIPAFQDNGTFSRDRYLRVLANQRLNPDDFEKMEQRQLLIEKIRDKIQKGVTVSDEAIAKEYRDRNEKISLAFVRLSPALFENRVKVDEAALQGYFTEHQEAFRLPETVSLRYLLFEPGQYAKDVTYDDGELQAYYRHHLDQFEVPEQVKAAHILIKLPPNASPELKEEKRKLAAEVLKKARAGQDFAQLAKKYSDDSGSAAKGGELGLFPRGAMVAPFEKAAFSLAPGQISDVVESPFGFHIIKVEQHIDAGVKPFAEVAETVKTGLRAEKAQKLAYEKAIDAYNINRQGGSLDKAAEANGLKIRETGYFDRQGSIDGLGEAPKIVSTVFSMQPGELARPVILPQGVVLFALKDRKESRRPELAEVRGKVEQAFRQEKAQELARQAAEKMLADLRQGKALDSLARAQGVKVEETGLFSRAYGSLIPRLGNSEELAKVAFGLTKEAPVAGQVFEQNGTFVVAKLTDRQAADMDALNQTKREELRQALLNQEKEQVLENRLKDLRSQAEITISPNIASSLNGENS